MTLKKLLSVCECSVLAVLRNADGDENYILVSGDKLMDEDIANLNVESVDCYDCDDDEITCVIREDDAFHKVLSKFFVENKS